jgi:hypothetical protein
MRATGTLRQRAGHSLRTLPYCSNNIHSTPRMLTTRIILPIIAFLGAITIAMASVLLPFIPTWTPFQTITAALALMGSVVASAGLIRGIWLQTRAKMQDTFRVLLTLATGFVMAAILYVAGMICLFLLSGGLFAPHFHHEVQFPDHNVTIYVYDNSFLDTSTLFNYRSGWWPFTHPIGSFGGVTAADTEIFQDGEWAVHEMFKLHLPSGELLRTYDLPPPD